MLTHEEYTTLSEMLQFTAYDGLSPVDARQGDNMYNIRMPSTCSISAEAMKDTLFSVARQPPGACLASRQATAVAWLLQT